MIECLPDGIALDVYGNVILLDEMQIIVRNWVECESLLFSHNDSMLGAIEVQRKSYSFADCFTSKYTSIAARIMVKEVAKCIAKRPSIATL
jgi:hypothetical protein